MKRVIPILAAVLLIVAAAVPQALAIYQQVDIEQVPIERLIANTERQIAEYEEGEGTASLVDLTERLARVHAIAYAQGAASLGIRAESGVLFEGYGWVPVLPWPRSETRGDHDHLVQALELYRTLLRQQPDSLRWQIGFAWCLEESRDTDQAIALYREVVRAGWEAEQQIDDLEYGELTVTQEAAYRLMELLDQDLNADEISELVEMNRHFEEIPRWITPLIVPLEDGVSVSELFDMSARVRFDLDGSGISREWRWLTSKAAWLVWDPEKTGEIRSGLQLFGAVTFWIFWENGYEALAALDDDNDGIVAGGELEHLALWRDDGDGISEPGEVLPLSAFEIEALSYAFRQHDSGFPYSPAGVLMADGSTRPSYDWLVPGAKPPDLLSSDASDGLPAQSSR